MTGTQKFLIIIAACCFFFCSCRQQPLSPVPPQMVCQVEVSIQKGAIELHRTYTTTPKMDAILHYLYALAPSGRADTDPEQLLCEVCKITVTLSGGQRHTYRQRDGKYLSVDCRPWQKVDPERTAVLFPLVRKLESDPPQSP